MPAIEGFWMTCMSAEEVREPARLAGGAEERTEQARRRLHLHVGVHAGLARRVLVDEAAVALRVRRLVRVPAGERLRAPHLDLREDTRELGVDLGQRARLIHRQRTLHAR